MPGEDRNEVVQQHLECLFRREFGRIVSTLTRVFGTSNLILAEDVVQEALLQALRHWSYGNIPRNPSAWLMRVAKNKALDVIRREKTFSRKENDIAQHVLPQSQRDPAALFSASEVEDDQLRMIFACCHTVLSKELQVALTLKTLCGFSVGEIARAFLLPEETISKRLVRAKRRLREAAVPFEIPDGQELSKRLDSVLQVLYLVFNEGYSASHGANLIRQDLCEEAIRLGRLLIGHGAGNKPKSHALLALMLLQSARFQARLEEEGSILLLHEQDRTRWDRTAIAEGIYHLDKAAEGDEASEFHLQAGIAACHCRAETYEATNWPQILSLYELLAKVNGSPVIALNRAVAIAKVHGPKAGIAALSEIQGSKLIKSHHLFYAVMADFLLELKEYQQAEQNYLKALELTGMETEQKFLRQRLRTCAENCKPVPLSN